ncbi:uncharacterized protein I303_104184 [Kwoniella dejecticola CBS 10117]|uniref:Uncharacterized protein n=1 Tax=Kwoniella dejecticola CBS 10117 TaxID=1296121 RepID=A0A1A6A615_9TREE|nr:uncharacterized protein I303_04838 [Kwoniella dejecticola CBS 10117]OBR85502.1 hypothetical protein I303_04838 [Kwoniella dejecticola CBS 10117]
MNASTSQNSASRYDLRSRTRSTPGRHGRHEESTQPGNSSDGQSASTQPGGEGTWLTGEWHTDYCAKLVRTLKARYETVEAASKRSDDALTGCDGHPDHPALVPFQAEQYRAWLNLESNMQTFKKHERDVQEWSSSYDDSTELDEVYAYVSRDSEAKKAIEQAHTGFDDRY